MSRTETPASLDGTATPGRGEIRAGAVPPGRYRSFVLISRPDDRYVAAVTLGREDGSADTRYYEYSPWVLPQLK